MKNKFTKDFIDHPYNPIRKFKTAWAGFWYVMKFDFSVTYKVIISVIVLGVSVFYRELFDVVILFIATGFMIFAEMFNSCVELLCDFHETGYNEKIKVIKDVAAAAAGIAILVWALIVGYEIWQLVF